MTDDIRPSETPPAPAAVSAGDTPFITEDMVKLALRRVKDPELNLNILDLGLVYEIRIDGTSVGVDMSLTSPACPSGAELVDDATTQIRSIAGVTDAQIFLVWSPPWTPDRIEPRVRAYLGF
jgi:metal-sulfur cluster biosynthetic enzyme